MMKCKVTQVDTVKKQKETTETTSCHCFFVYFIKSISKVMLIYNIKVLLTTFSKYSRVITFMGIILMGKNVAMYYFHYRLIRLLFSQLINCLLPAGARLRIKS